jgi:hypothetical protein
MPKTRAAAVLLFYLAFVPGVEAGPATLHIGTGAGTACAEGCGGDPNLIGPDVLSIFQNSGGTEDLLSPLLLILGLPNITGLASAPTIDFVNEYDPYPGTFVGAAGFSLGGAPSYGWSGAGFAGNWTSSDPQVYEFLGLEPPNTNSSNNDTNWFGVAPAGTTFFGIYVYRIDETLGDKGLFDVHWAGAGLPLGTIAIAYGCSSVSLGTGHCSSGGAVYSTPFTEAGNVIPEPGTLALLGSGLVGLAAALRRRRRA